MRSDSWWRLGVDAGLVLALLAGALAPVSDEALFSAQQGLSLRAAFPQLRPVGVSAATIDPSCAPAPNPSSTALPAGEAGSVPAPTTVATPAAGVWPGASNTGVPAGTKLTVHEGDLLVRTPNAVIDSMEIRGLVRIEAPGVVIKNSLITGRYLSSSLSLIYVNGDNYSVTVQDSELYAKYPSPYVRGVIGRNYTLLRVNVHHVTDQLSAIGDNVLVQDSWLHDNLYYENDPLQGTGATHDDNIQIVKGNNIKLVHNTFEDTHNAAVQVTQDGGLVSNLTVERNMISNGACSVNLAQNKYGPVQKVVLKDNVFTHTSKYNCPIIADWDTVAQMSVVHNTWIDTKTTVPVTGRTTGNKGA